MPKLEKIAPVVTPAPAAPPEPDVEEEEEEEEEYGDSMQSASSLLQGFGEGYGAEAEEYYY